MYFTNDKTNDQFYQSDGNLFLCKLTFIYSQSIQYGYLCLKINHFISCIHEIAITDSNIHAEHSVKQ